MGQAWILVVWFPQKRLLWSYPKVLCCIGFSSRSWVNLRMHIS
jgi:hypothetical protein